MMTIAGKLNELNKRFQFEDSAGAGANRFVHFLPTDPNPHLRAPVSSLSPVPDMPKGVEWAFKIPIRAGGQIVVRKTSQEAMPQSQSSSALRWSERTSLLIIVILIGVFSYQAIWEHRTGTFADFGDLEMSSSLSQEAIRDGRYPTQLYYPPPGVIARAWLTRLGNPASGLVWMSVIILSLVYSLVALLRFTGLHRHRHRNSLALASMLVVLWFIQWDFRAMNSNTVLLALVLAATSAFENHRPARAGFALATSVALKVYSAILIPYWLWRRDGIAVAWALASLVFWFVVVPVLYLGPQVAWELSQSWLEVVVHSAQPSFVVDHVSYKVSVRWLLANILGEVGYGISMKIAAWPPAWTNGLARILELFFLLAVTIWIVRSRQSDATSSRPSRGLLDVGLLLICTLFMSPLLQPHHGALLLIPATLLVAAAVDKARPIVERRAIAAGLVILPLSLKLAPSGLPKAAVVICMLLAFSAGLIYIARDRSLRPPTSDAPSP